MRFPSIVICLAGPALLAAEIKESSNLAGLDAARIGFVAVQDRSKKQVLEDGVDAALAALLRSESFQPVPLAYQPPADVEYAARQAHCAYILPRISSRSEKHMATYCSARRVSIIRAG